MRVETWHHGLEAAVQIAALSVAAEAPGLLRVEFTGGGNGEPLPWRQLEPWTRSRSVTVAAIRGALAAPALEVALCCDLVYVEPQAVLTLAPAEEPPPAGVIWALGRAGRAALARGLLDPRPLTADEAVELGLAQAVVAVNGALPLPGAFSIAALTAARDLMRSAADGSDGGTLESATFRLLFASGDPREGARAFLGKREPDF